MHKPKEKNGYMSGVPAVEQAVAILTHLSSVPRFTANLTDISKNVGISISKALAILNTLEKSGHVTRDSNGKRYALGLKLVPLGYKALEELNYADVVKPFVKALARETHSSALFGLISGKYLVVIAKGEPHHELASRIQVGQALRLFYRAHGRAIAAFLPAEQREKLLSAANCGFDSDPSFIDRAQLEQDLEFCLRNGFSTDIGTINPMIKTLASPVFGVDGYPKGSLFIIGFFRKSAIGAYGAKVAKKARELSEALGWVGDDVNPK